LPGMGPQTAASRPGLRSREGGRHGTAAGGGEVGEVGGAAGEAWRGGRLARWRWLPAHGRKGVVGAELSRGAGRERNGRVGRRAFVAAGATAAHTRSCGRAEG